MINHWCVNNPQMSDDTLNGHIPYTKFIICCNDVSFFLHRPASRCWPIWGLEVICETCSFGRAESVVRLVTTLLQFCMSSSEETRWLSAIASVDMQLSFAVRWLARRISTEMAISDLTVAFSILTSSEL